MPSHLLQQISMLLCALHTQLRAIALVSQQPSRLVELTHQMLDLLLQARALHAGLLQLRLGNLREAAE